MASGTAPQPRHERAFYLAFVVAAWAAVVAGFEPSVTQRWRGAADYPAPPILVWHVAAVTAWLLLLTAQVLLINRSRLALHRNLGLTVLVLIPVIVVTGLGAEIYSQRFFSPKYPENLRFFIAPIMEMLAFTIAATLAVVKRRNSAAHKRLILIATSVLLTAAYSRWWGEPLYSAFGDGLGGVILHNFAGPNLLIALAAVHDWWRTGRIHPVYLVAGPAVLGGELVASFIYHSDAWPTLARRLVGL